MNRSLRSLKVGYPAALAALVVLIEFAKLTV
jgi:hypothetical protein